MANIFFATAILWILNAACVAPLTKMIIRRRLAMPAYAYLGTMTPDAVQAEVGRLATRIFIMVDVLVMFTAGAIAGSAGYPLIGFARSLKAWPGMVALIAASFYFAHLAHA